MKSIRKSVALIGIVLATLCPKHTWSYEINNHGDMSQIAVEKSVLSLNNNAKLLQLGLKKLDIASPRQTFQLDDPLGPIPYCFGSRRPDPFKVTTPDIPPGGPQDPSITPPNWYGSGYSLLTIAQLIRYGACYDGEEEPNIRSISHFYDPQNQGAGATFGPSSLKWMLGHDPIVTGNTGTNHLTCFDARDAFFQGLTIPDPLDRALPGVAKLGNTNNLMSATRVSS